MAPIIRYENGIAIEGLEFLLDARRRCECSFVSHAHTDHARKHERIIATPETVLMYRSRYPSVPARAIPFGRRVKFGKATVELFPSGHMLGAAQILVEVGAVRIVYTGDFKVYPNLTCPSVEVRRCDILIMESTYGDPQFAFPPQGQVHTRIVSFVERAMMDGYIPVLVGYAMGKAQEAVALMQKRGYQVLVDKAIAEVNELYRKAGVKLEPTTTFAEERPQGKVIVVAPQSLKDEEYRKLRRTRSLFLSGWSQSKRRRGNFGADLGVPLSDHADFTQLIEYVRQCGATKVYTLHGEPHFAHLLREHGIDAEYLTNGFDSEQSVMSRLPAEGLRTAQGENYELF